MEKTIKRNITGVFVPAHIWLSKELTWEEKIDWINKQMTESKNEL